MPRASIPRPSSSDATPSVLRGFPEAPTELSVVDQRRNITLTVLTGPENMGYCLKAAGYWAIGLSALSLGENWDHLRPGREERAWVTKTREC